LALERSCLCARSTDWQSAISRIGNPQTVRTTVIVQLADCQSATRQTNCLRYRKAPMAPANPRIVSGSRFC
jgi:hypothetical protein